MEDFRRQFLIETAEKLENLQRNLPAAKDLSLENKHEIFRILHTIKGTAQTFGYASMSRLAHDLESLLSINGDGKNLLVEGIGFLQKSLTEEKFQIPEQFRKKLQAAIPNAAAVDDSNDAPVIPAEFYSQLSHREKETINGRRDGEKFAVLETAFNLANFAAELISFREVLSSAGEIVATFPGVNSNAHGKIGFQFLVAGVENAENLASENGASVLWENSDGFSMNNLDAVLKQIVRHGKELAAKLGKQIEFELENNDLKLSPAELKIVFESLLHLVRNAIDHAIETVGTIKISIAEKSNALRISVSDEGFGIDFELIKAKAVEKKLIAADENLSEAATLDLIFQPEFSTKIETTEISGRGIGLDAVKNTVEKNGGKITVKTGKGKGTTFEINLPRRES